MKRRILLTLAAVSYLGLCWSARFVNAQSTPPKDVPPYLVSNIEAERDVNIYKTVYQGCELFVVTEPYYGHVSVAITTGRGCR